MATLFISVGPPQAAGRLRTASRLTIHTQADQA